MVDFHIQAFSQSWVKDPIRSVMFASVLTTYCLLPGDFSLNRVFCNSYWHSIYNGLVLIIFVAMTYSSPEDVHALYINTTTFHPRHLSFGCWGMTIFITSSLHCCAFAFLPSSCQRSFVPFGNFLTAPSRHSLAAVVSSMLASAAHLGSLLLVLLCFETVGLCFCFLFL